MGDLTSLISDLVPVTFLINLVGALEVAQAAMSSYAAHVVDAIDGFVATALTIYVVLYGFALMQGHVREVQHDAFVKMFKLAVVNRASEEQAAVAKYGALKTAFTTRDAIMARAGDVSHPQVVADGADKHIVDAILSGHIATLNIAAQQIPEHQAVEQQHELQG